MHQKKRESAHSTITVTYKDDAKEEFLVWVDNTEHITIAKDEKKDKVEGVTVNIKNTKMMKDFLKCKRISFKEILFLFIQPIKFYSLSFKAKLLIITFIYAVVIYLLLLLQKSTTSWTT